MRRWAWLAALLSACGGGISIEEYPTAFRDAYCKYETRCGLFPDIGTCERANIGFNLVIDPSEKAAVDQGKTKFDGALASDCLDAFGAQTCDTTDEDGRAFFTEKCREIVKGTVGDGGACALDIECKSQTCNVPSCPDACCQGTCMGDALPTLGGAGATCGNGSNSCAVGFYCDFTTTTCMELKAAGATCNANNECAFGLGCAGTPARTCKALPALGEACPDGACRDAGTFCNAVGMCAKIGLAGATCGASVGQCSSFYPCDQSTMKCTAAPALGEACTNRCFDGGTFCDTSSPTPTCVKTKADGGSCTSDSQCENNNCDTGSGGGSGTCATAAVCI
jgi:hypothetical protein